MIPAQQTVEILTILRVAMQLLGAMAIIPYAVTSCFSVTNNTVTVDASKEGLLLCYHVRVVVPCYRESLTVVGKVLLVCSCPAVY